MMVVVYTDYSKEDYNGPKLGIFYVSAYDQAFFALSENLMPMTNNYINCRCSICVLCV